MTGHDISRKAIIIPQEQKALTAGSDARPTRGRRLPSPRLHKEAVTDQRRQAESGEGARRETQVRLAEESVASTVSFCRYTQASKLITPTS